MPAPMWKEVTERDEKYLAWIRTHPCHECGYPAPSDAHHIETGGISLKCSDYLTVPLCKPFARGCHNKADKSKSSAEKYRPIAVEYHRKWREGR